MSTIPKSRIAAHVRSIPNHAPGIDPDRFDNAPFVQIGAFLDGPEDDIASECVQGCAPNPTFDQLAREERSEGTNFINGDAGLRHAVSRHSRQSPTSS